MKPAARLIAAALALGGTVVFPAAAQETATIVGFGSSYPAPLINQWANDLYGVDGLLVDYTPVGSEHGRAAFLKGEGDFVLSDIPFHPQEKAKAEAEGRTFAYAPVAAGPLAFTFNLIDPDNQQIKELKLSPATIAKIFTGDINNWGDPAVTADNGGTPVNYRAPGSILTFTRSDGNGTTWAFSSWIKSVAPEAWKAYTARFDLPDEPLERWPSQNTARSASSPEVAAQRVAAGDIPNSITYLPPPFAASAPNLATVAVKNASGNFVKPTPDSAAKALTAATFDPATHLMTPNYDAPDPDAYPLVMASYIIAPLAKASPASQTRLASFLQFVMDHPQVASEGGYASLPASLAEGTKAVISQLKSAAQAAGTTTTTASSAPASTTTTTDRPASTTTTATSPSTTTTAAPPSTTSTTVAATDPGGASDRSALGSTLADTGATIWRWKLPFAAALACSGEGLRRRRRR